MNIEDYNNTNGIIAIKFLQAMADIDESDENAQISWENMSISEKKHTINTYEIFMKLKEAAKEI